MQELYEAVLAKAKTAVETNAASREAEALVSMAIRLHNCLRAGIVTASDLFLPDGKETGR